jgi:hypothetical protein
MFMACFMGFTNPKFYKSCNSVFILLRKTMDPIVICNPARNESKVIELNLRLPEDCVQLSP